MTTSMTRAAKLYALLAATSLAAPALAQSGSNPISGYLAPPAEMFAITPGGVDIRTGQYAYSHTDLSIGEGSESGGIALTRIMSPGVLGHKNPFSNFSHNWNIMITEKRVDMDRGDYTHRSGLDYRISVRFAGKSETYDSHRTNSGFNQTSKTSLAVLSFTGDRASDAVVYKLETNDGTIVTFRALGSRDCSSEIRCAYASEIVQPDGTKFTLGYDNPSGTINGTRLRSVVSSRGYALLIDQFLSTSGNNPTRACVLNLAHVALPANNSCPAGVPTSSYSQDSFQLYSATDATGAIWRFTYPGTGKIGFVRAGETSPWLINTGSGAINEDGGAVYVVDLQEFATGESYYYEYDSLPDPLGNRPFKAIAGGRYVDAAGRQTIVRYDFPLLPKSMRPTNPDPLYVPPENLGDNAQYYQLTPGPVEITDPLGRTTHYDYCDAYLKVALPATDTDRCLVTQLQSYTDPEGIRTELSYGGREVTQVRRKAKSGSTLDDIIVSATYAFDPKTRSKPASVTDARRNTTNFTYDPAHGGVLTETGPAVNGIRPQKRYAYAQRYAWLKNATFGYSRASTPVWLLTSMSMCRTSAATGNPSAPCATPGDEVLTTYDYGPDSGPNNLQLRGTVVTADGQSLRTCQSYDQNGRRISETGASANLATCN